MFSSNFKFRFVAVCLSQSSFVSRNLEFFIARLRMSESF